MKLVRIAFKTLLLTVMAVSLLLGALGVSSVLLTLTVYALLIGGSRQLCFALIRPRERAVNAALLFTSLWGSMLAGELALRYVFKTGLERQELNDEFFYSLPYGPDVVNRLARKWVLKIDDPTLITRKPPTISKYRYVLYLKVGD